MKQLLSGTTLAAVLALSLPAWAQLPPDMHQHAPSMQQQPSAARPQAAPSAGAPTGTTAEQGAEGMPRRQMMRRHERRHSGGQMHQRMRRGSTARSGSEPSDNVADQLNRQEAQRLSVGGMPSGMGPGSPSMPMPGGPAPGQPRPGSAQPGAPI